MDIVIWGLIAYSIGCMVGEYNYKVKLKEKINTLKNSGASNKFEFLAYWIEHK